MSRSVAPLRGRKGARRFDPSDLRQLLRDERLWAQLGTVRKVAGAAQHWELVDGHILVDVETHPRRLELRCRLGTAAGGMGRGLWRVPAVGEEVAVLVPDGEIDFYPIIVAVLESGTAPDRVGDDRTLLVATDIVEITAPVVEVRAGTVKMSDTPDALLPIDGVLTGQAIDPFTGLAHFALGNASAHILGKKV